MIKAPFVKKDKFTPKEIAEGLEQSPQEEEIQEKVKQPRQKWLFLSILLAIVIIGSGLNYWFLISQKHAFSDLIPENSTATALINQTDFYPQISVFSQAMGGQVFLGQEAGYKLNQYFNQAGLSFKDDVLPLFVSKAALVALPANSDTPLPLVMILKRKAGLAKVSQILEAIEPEIGKDFNVSSEDYRQINMVVLNPLSGPSIEYAYALIEEYLVISNSQKSLEDTIDSIISQ